MTITSERLFIVLLLALAVLTGCQEGIFNTPTPEEILRTRLETEFPDVAFGKLHLKSVSVSTSNWKVACRITVLMDPAGRMMMQPPLAEGLIDAAKIIAHDIYPEAAAINLFLRTGPDMAKYQSAQSLDLDGVPLNLGMTRPEVLAAIELSDWRVTYTAQDELGLSSMPLKSSHVYFDGESEDATVIYLVPPSNAPNTGGFSSIVADVQLTGN